VRADDGCQGDVPSAWYTPPMRPHRISTWREFIFEFFGRAGLFSLRPMPMTEAEREEAARDVAPPKGITRLNLDSAKAKNDSPR
jgi:hypothetical protein